MPPGVRPARLVEKGEALSKLERLAEILREYTERFIGGEDAKRVWSFLSKRLEGARDVILHAEDRLAGLRRLDNGYLAVFVSSRYAGRPVTLRKVLVKTLEGGVAEVTSGARLEEAVYHVELGPYAAKCTCPDAIYTGARADQALTRAGFPPQAYRFVPCKHVLALLALLWARGEVRPDKPPYDELLLRLVVTAYLATLGAREKPRISRIALVYTRRGETSTPYTLN